MLKTMMGCILFILGSCSATTTDSSHSISAKPITFEVEATSIASKQTTKILVYLPTLYMQKPEKHYPLVFFLHGWGSDAAAFERLGGVQAMSALDDNQQFIVVAVNGETSDYRNWSDGVTNWENHLLGSVTTVVKSNFRILKEPENHAIYGVSMGGAAALRIVMSHSEHFRCAASHSAAISSPDFDTLPEWQKTGYQEMDDFRRRYGEPFQPEDWKAANPLHIAKTTNAEELGNSDYYFDVGVSDQLGFADGNATLSAVLAAKGIPHTFSLREGRHGADFVEANIGAAMGFLSNCLSPD